MSPQPSPFTTSLSAGLWRAREQERKMGCTPSKPVDLQLSMLSTQKESTPSTAFNYYTALLETSKKHFYGPRSGLIEF